MIDDEVDEDEGLTFREWKHECAKIVSKLLHIDDLLEEDDPYDTFETMEEAYEEGVTPEEYIRDTFDEDLAKIDYDAELLRLSEESSDAEAWDDDDDYEAGEDDSDEED